MPTMPPTSTPGPVARRFTVIGMTCSHCENAIANEVGAIAGVTFVAADAATGSLIVESATELDVDQVAAAVDEAGYELVR